MVYGGIGPHTPAMLFNNALDNRQTDARAFKFFLAVQALKNAKKFIGILHIESGPVIADKDSRFSIQKDAADFDDCHLAVAAVLNGITKQIGKNLPQHSHICFNIRQLPQPEFNLAPFARLALAQFSVGAANQFCEINAFLPDLLTTDMRKRYRC